MSDGRVISNGSVAPPEPLVRAARGRLSAAIGAIRVFLEDRVRRQALDQIVDAAALTADRTSVAGAAADRWTWCRLR